MGGDQVPLCTSGVPPPGARLALWSQLLSALSTEKYLKDSGNELTFFSFFLSSPSFSKTVQPSWKKANKTSVTILKIIGKPVLNAMALNGSPGRMCCLGSPLFLTPRCTCGEKAGQPSALKSEELMGPEEHPCPKRPCAPHTWTRRGVHTCVWPASTGQTAQRSDRLHSVAGFCQAWG